MTSTSVILPYRRDDGIRDEHLTWVLDRWTDHYPVFVGLHEDGMWNKAKAVAKALSQTQSETLIVADADVWMPQVDQLKRAVEHVQRHGGWAVPHHYVHRLDEEATKFYKDTPILDYRKLPHARTPYGGMVGGGMFVIRRWDYLRVGGLDPAFEGHTGEDEALGLLLSTLIGLPWRGRADLVHLWHPEQSTKKDSRVRQRNNELLSRYKRNRGKRGSMSKQAEQIRTTIRPILDEGTKSAHHPSKENA